MQPNQIIVVTITKIIMMNRSEDSFTKVIHEICNKTPHFGIAVQVCSLKKREMWCYGGLVVERKKLLRFYLGKCK